MFTWDTLPDLLFLFFSRYLAGFSMLSVLTWVVIVYLRRKDNYTAIRDGINYILAIGLLATVILLLPRESYSIIWQMILWFTFTVLLVLELLWLAYLLVSLIHLAKSVGIRRDNQGLSASNNPSTPYSRFPINNKHI